ncbi:MAG TPA: hypothetical protein PLU21_03770 [Candidatus Saccharibacteria bacterium]|nr:hypothetical protein [Candidatus Saccharibacteria bacterium]
MKKISVAALAVVAVLVGGLLITQLTRVNAVTSETQYSYDLRNVQNGAVVNQATKNSGTKLYLEGNWSQHSSGVQFDGNKTNMQSVGQAKPGSTATLTASDAIGAGVEFQYDASAGACTSDSRNVTQIGRFATGASQLKIQFSSCSANKKATFVECRVVGSGAVSTDKPVRSTLALVDGMMYVASCARDVKTGSTRPVTLSVTPVGGQTVSNVFAYRDSGTFNATGYLSVGNKYPLPAVSKNTDQFTGIISRVVYCSAANLNDVDACLASW